MHYHTHKLLGKKARFLENPRQGREGSARARTQLFLLVDTQCAHWAEGRGGGGLGVRSVKLSVPTGETRSMILVSDSYPFLPMAALHCETLVILIECSSAPPRTQLRIRSTVEAKKQLTPYLTEERHGKLVRDVNVQSSFLPIWDHNMVTVHE